ncbi:MAG: tetratricopeptide repeat protein [Myxococcota bacterium]|nr:tetratricopeptide repeat protein [Myxococcota bacterium]
MTFRPGRALAAGLAIAAAIAVAGCTSDEEAFQNHMETAQALIEQGEQREALIELRNALQLDPKNAEVNFQIAQLLMESGRYVDATFFFRETTRLDPTRADAALNEARLILFDDTERAEQLITRALELEPANALGHVRRSELALAQGDADAALEAALTAIEVDPDDPLGHSQLGFVHQARIRESRLSRETPPDELFEAALAAFRRADELLGGGPNVRVETARVYATWPGHREEAYQAYRDAFDIAKPGEQRGRVAGSAMSLGRANRDPEFLLWALEMMVSEVPTNLPAWDELAVVSEGQEPSAGDAVYRRLLEVRPQDDEAHVRFALFMARNGRRDEAIAHLEGQAGSGVDPAVALDRVVALHLGSRDPEAARAVYTRLRSERPDQPRTKLAAARIAISERRFDEAAKDLRTYLGLEQNVEAQRMLALTELQRRNYPAAIAAADTAIQLTNGPARDMQRLKARIYFAAEDWLPVTAILRRLARGGAELSPSEQVMLATALYESNRPRPARRVLSRLLESESPPAAAMLEYGVREAENDPEGARRYLEQVLERSPRNRVALRELTDRDLAEGRTAEAVARLERAADAGPLPPLLLLLRAQVMIHVGDLEQAEESARRAFAAAPQLAAALDILARIYTEQGRLAEAIESFSEADAAGALPAPGQVLLARLHLAAGQRQEARAVYEKVLVTRSDLAGAKNDLAWLLAEEGADLERALTLAQEAQQAIPDSPNIADTLGYVYYRKGLHEAALQQFEYAIELLGEESGDGSAEFHYHLGLALRALGRESDAIPALERALALDEEFSDAEQARRELEAARASLSASSS